MRSTKDAAEAVADAYLEMNNAKAPVKVFKEKAKPALEAGSKQLTENVKWGKKASDGAVDPKKI